MTVITMPRPVAVPRRHGKFIAMKGNRRKAINRAATEFEKIAAIQKYIGLFSSEKVAQQILMLTRNKSALVFWSVFAVEWSGCDDAYDFNSDFVERFKRNGPCPSQLRSGFWNSLDDQLVVYRGTSRSRVDGIAWSVDRTVADKFAKGMRGIAVPDPVIATGVVAKADIYFATDDREEAEVLCRPKNIRCAPLTPRKA